MARPRSSASASSTTNADSEESDPPNFEEAMRELENIVHALESEPLPLDDLVGKYERGMNLLRQCRQQIDSAQLRIEQITLRGETQPAPVAIAAHSEPSSSRTRPEAAVPNSADDDEIRLF